MLKINSQKDLEKLQREILSKCDRRLSSISVCTSTGCSSLGSLQMVKALREELKKQGLADKVSIKETGCMGLCELGPHVTINSGEQCYFRVKPEDASTIVSKTIIGKKVISRLLYTDPTTGKKSRKLDNIPFYKHQRRLLLENNVRIDPKSIGDYIALGGYRALTKALTQMKPEEVLEVTKKSGLRGRGGGGFLTGIKWETTRNAPGEPKYVIVNCDEGDPGAFMDRSLMEGNPHLILEGLIIGAYAIGASQGYVYVREEYPLAVENITIALKQAIEYGFLGEKILDSDFSFNVEVHKGAGAFVSGESSALMTAIEGKVGEPRSKYIHTAAKGIRDKPSCLNNVETWANIPFIILNGSDWFRSLGTPNNSGTKIFSLVGKVKNTGLVEIPLGMTLRDIIFKIGGGIRDGKKFKAVQTGGPSGGVIPEQYLDTSVDFDSLTELGSMMGSGGMIVMDEDTCMVDVARFFINFLLEESCGKCIPCREGLRVLDKLLSDICVGQGHEEDISVIEDVAETMKEASLCALGTTAANPVLSTLKYFRDEYEAHIKQHTCPANVCKELTAYYITSDKCTACMICLNQCPTKAITGEKDFVRLIDQVKCTKCGICYASCPFGSIEKISPPTRVPVKPPIRVQRKK
ncbi:MAG: NADH-ubiquinone oxidoreductase-F iron-sulfur binding region domain-containing protein [Candidatus Bathyarchaeota archaeon]